MRLLLLLLLLAAPVMAATDSDRINTVVNSSYPRGVRPTGSMKPAFDENYLLLCQSRDKRPLCERKVGDVILFLMKRDDGEIWLVVHRIYAISSAGGMVVTKGDNNARPDVGYVTTDNYMGLVVGWVRKDLPEVTALEAKESVRFVLNKP